jgi:hypothetical protein
VGSGRATGLDARGTGSVTGIGPWSRMVVQALLARWLRLGQSSAVEIKESMLGIGGKVYYHAWNVTVSLVDAVVPVSSTDSTDPGPNTEA